MIGGENKAGFHGNSRAQVYLDEDLSRLWAEPLGAGRRRSSRLLCGGEGLRSLDLVGERERESEAGREHQVKNVGGEHQAHLERWDLL